MQDSTPTDQPDLTPVEILYIERELPREYVLKSFRLGEFPDQVCRYDICLEDEEPYSATIELRRHKGQLWIDNLKVRQPHRGKGFASYLLDTILLNYPDETLYLRANPIKETVLSQQELIDFYARHGFRVIDEEGRMVREAKIDYSQET